MLVSCICPTYGRAPNYLWLLEETIYSFLIQDYPRKELIVLNDTPGQELYCNAPNVRIVNLPARIQSLGQKYNAAISSAKGELICPWEDDDISLPHRLSLSVRMLGNDDYYNPHRYWFLDTRGMHNGHSMGVCHNCSIYRKTAWDKVGRYPHVSGPQDAQFHQRLIEGSRVADQLPPTVKEWFYIYRWGVSPVHLSSRHPRADEFYAEVGRRPITRGTFALYPHWREDYEARCMRYNEGK